MYQLGVMGIVDLWVIDYLFIMGSVFVNIVNNYDKFNYINLLKDLYLLWVCMYVCEYVQNDVYVNNLQVNYFQYFGNGFYGQVYGGYLEIMFGGVGVEVLYCLVDSNWVFGLDVNYVKQCDWCSVQDMMKFIDYSVKIGYLIVYWMLLFVQDVLVKVSVGQYLVGDKGGMLEIVKCFDSGVVVGGYVMIIDVLLDKYGEGDFIKGVYVFVLLDIFLFGLI